MRAKIGGSLTFLRLETPSLNPVLGARYGDGLACLQPRAFFFSNCSGIKDDLTVYGTTNPSGGGPYIPLLQLASNSSINTNKEFVPKAAHRLYRQAFCTEPGTYSAVRLRTPRGELILGQGLQASDVGGDDAESGALARIQIKDSLGRWTPNAALQTMWECVRPVAITVEFAAGQTLPEEFHIDMWNGAAAELGNWTSVMHVVNQTWPSKIQKYVIDPALAQTLPVNVTASRMFESGEASSGTPFEWSLANNVFESDKEGVEGFLYQATLVGGAPLPPWLVFDAQTALISAPDAVSFEGTDDRDRLEIEIKAIDGQGDSAVFTYYMLVTSTVPSQIRPLPDVVMDHLSYIHVDTKQSFQANVRDPTLTFSATGLPSWAKLDSNTGLLTGLPGIDGAGTVSTITVTATDIQGDTVSASFDVDVKLGCYEGFRYFKLMAFVSSTDSQLKNCIANFDSEAALRPFFSWIGADGIEHMVYEEPMSYSTQLGLVYDLGEECAVPASFKIGDCPNVPTLKVLLLLLLLLLLPSFPLPSRPTAAFKQGFSLRP